MKISSKEIRIASLLLLDTVFFFLELIVGYSVHSLALIADSFHMLNDIISLIIALWAVKVSQTQQPDANYTYGWKRAEILGALVNAIFLIALCVSIFIEAVQRFFEPQEIGNPKLVLGVGVAGLISNFIGLILFHEHGHGHSHSHGGTSHSSPQLEDLETHGHDHSHASISINDIMPDTIVHRASQALGTRPSVSAEHEPLLVNDSKANYGSHESGHSHAHSHEDDLEDLDQQVKKSSGSLNMHGVFLHVLGDALGNVGVILSGVFIWKTDYSWRFYSDPVVSLFITIIICASAIPLSTKACKILLQATPADINADLVKAQILKIKGVYSVHDFHIWNLDESFSIASLHVEIKCSPDEYMLIAKKIRNIFHKFNIHSATVQPEFLDDSAFGADNKLRFSRIAGGGVSYEEDTANVNTSNADSTIGDRKNSKQSLTGEYGVTTLDTGCLVDEVSNCNADSCLN
ncbi:hypothetical protein ACO0R3_000690 [Hanseniaspora guilliermondii]